MYTIYLVFRFRIYVQALNGVRWGNLYSYCHTCTVALRRMCLKKELEKTVDKLVIQIIPSAIEENIKKYP